MESLTLTLYWHNATVCWTEFSQKLNFIVVKNLHCQIYFNIDEWQNCFCSFVKPSVWVLRGMWHIVCVPIVVAVAFGVCTVSSYANSPLERHKTSVSVQYWIVTGWSYLRLFAANCGGFKTVRNLLNLNRRRKIITLNANFMSLHPFFCKKFLVLDVFISKRSKLHDYLHFTSRSWLTWVNCVSFVSC